MKIRVGLLAGIIIGSIMLSGCRQIMTASVGAASGNTGDEMVSDDERRYEITEHDRTVLTQNAVEINLDLLEDGVGIDGVYTYEKNCLTIKSGGSYLLSGELDGGNIVVNTYNDEVVHLVLNNAQIHAQSTPAIYGEMADKVILTAVEGSRNILSDNARQQTELDSCIFGNCDLTINGYGELMIYGYHADAVRSKDQLKIVNANLYAKAKGDGLRGNDGVIIADSITQVECEGTGIYANSAKDVVMIYGGNCKVVAGQYAIAADQRVVIHDVTTDLYSVLETVKCDGIIEIEDYTGEN